MFVRTDLPLPQQLVQSNHAAYEAGILFGDKSQTEPSSLIVIAIKNQAKLQKAIDHLRQLNIQLVEFIEPDWEYGLTAFATQPLTQEQRQVMRKYQLWK